MLARREHSRHELSNKLLRRSYDPSIISPVLDALEAEGLLQDWRFAEAYVVARTARGFGPLRVRQELKQRGVCDELIDAYCNGKDPCWSECALNAWRKRFANVPVDSFNAWAKQARYLQQRGFDASHINTALGDYEE